MLLCSTALLPPEARTDAGDVPGEGVPEGDTWQKVGLVPANTSCGATGKHWPFES